jgi:hypothetical protein
MAERMQPWEVETLYRSSAMAPLAPDTVRRVLEAHRELLASQARLEATIARLQPAWVEVREILNELATLMREA